MIRNATVLLAFVACASATMAQTTPIISPGNQTVRLVEFAAGLGGFNDGRGQLNQYVPTDLVQLENGNWLATTLGGPVRLIDASGAFVDSTPAPYLLLPSAVGGFGNELNYGTTAVEPHPEFLQQGTPGYGKLYAIVTRPQSDDLSVDFGFGDSHFDRLVEYTADDPLASSPVWTSRAVMTIQQPSPIHNLFDLDFGSDGLLFASLGDGGSNRTTAQDASTIFGNVIRINPSDPYGVAPTGQKLSENGQYSIPLDNPMIGEPNAVEEAWAFGLRSPFTLNFSNNGELYLGDVGQGRREEVNRITRGSNQSWSVLEGTAILDRQLSLVPGTNHNPPVFEYDHAEGRAVVAGFVYDGEFFPEMRGKFVFGDFQGQTQEQDTPVGRLFYGDLSSSDIFEFNYDNLGLNLEGLSILNIGQDAEGELYLATSVASTAEQAPSDPNGGAIFRLIPLAGGDYNGDGVVTAADYTDWRDSMGSTSDLRADGDRSGKIDQGDYQVWRFNYGHQLLPIRVVTLPEPSTLCAAVLIVHALGLAGLRRIRFIGTAANNGPSDSRVTALRSRRDNVNRNEDSSGRYPGNYPQFVGLRLPSITYSSGSRAAPIQLISTVKPLAAMARRNVHQLSC